MGESSMTEPWQGMAGYNWGGRGVGASRTSQKGGEENAVEQAVEITSMAGEHGTMVLRLRDISQIGALKGGK
ncbi:hypothetical protein NPX13_g750 [Xylaria arbuscula]|uniref:Uncharacterized protein n=1 Tax=Xylaria arbuscula TaxID=114810 RepID=A0A9W8NMA0_9PEZI|nr:hypothetical protein NPX13_g750 [Xylaria arbuscula]